MGPLPTPGLVCVDISEDKEHEQVTKVVLGIEVDDLQFDRDADRHELVYDDNMERVSPQEHYAPQALSAADPSQWPERDDWEEGPDALRDRWLYEDGDGIDDEDDLEDDEAGAGEATVASDPAAQPARTQDGSLLQGTA